jgi:hypothetical protein
MTKKTISLADFLKLGMDEQVELLHRDGTYVGKREVNSQVAVLFQLHDFYAEIWYLDYRRHIDRIRASASTELLLPYLDQVNVRDLDSPPKES